ncbi:MAG: CrcB family protein [Nocardioides sp.]|nr:CrcB family protein [Nocardioides sp.]
MTPLLVALGAAIGAPLRYVAGHHLDGVRGVWPIGTMLVNVVGSFLVGWLSALSLEGHHVALLGVGFCGALTTYSSFVVHTADLGLRRGAIHAVATIGLAVAACLLGFVLA